MGKFRKLVEDILEKSNYHNEFMKNTKDYDYLGYHGSNEIINKFTEPKARMNTWGIGIYFTNQYEEAKKHGEHVAKCMLKIKNPLVLKDSWFDNDDLLHSIGIQKLYHLGSEDSQEKIVKAGYDGIIVNNVDGHKNLKYYIVFSPEQIYVLSSDFHDNMTE